MGILLKVEWKIGILAWWAKIRQILKPKRLHTALPHGTLYLLERIRVLKNMPQTVVVPLPSNTAEF